MTTATSAVTSLPDDIYGLYLALLARPADAQFLYAGELCVPRIAMIRAANIAGMATLTATADLEAQKMALRDGVVDFLVTSLSEALRILKNEVRKKQTVAVCVARSVEAIEAEMQERGVLPDLRWNTVTPLTSDSKIVAIEIPTTYAGRTAEFDALLMEHLAEKDTAERRWMRLAPRYLGQQMRCFRLVACSLQTAEKIRTRIANDQP